MGFNRGIFGAVCFLLIFVSRFLDFAPKWSGKQACNWVWDDWDERDSKGILEKYASIYMFNAHLLIRLYVFAMLATSPATI